MNKIHISISPVYEILFDVFYGETKNRAARFTLDVKDIQALNNILCDAINFVDDKKVGKCVYCGENCFAGQEVYYNHDSFLHMSCLHTIAVCAENNIVLPLKKLEFEENNKTSGYKVSEKYNNSIFNLLITEFSDEIFTLRITDNVKQKNKYYSLTYSHAVELIDNIRIVISELKLRQLGMCWHCNNPLYKGTQMYRLKNGKIIHEICLDEFTQSKKAKGDAFPAMKINIVDSYEIKN